MGLLGRPRWLSPWAQGGVGAGLGSWSWGRGHSRPYLAGSSPGMLGTCCVHPGWVTQPFAGPHPHASMLPYAAVSMLRVVGKPDGWGDEISTCNSDARVYASLIRSNFCLRQSPMAPTLTPTPLLFTRQAEARGVCEATL